MRSSRGLMAAAIASAQLMALSLAMAGRAFEFSELRDRERHRMLPSGKRPKWGPDFNRGTGAGVDRAIAREKAKREADAVLYANTPNLARR